jgi:CBS domain containing-hemolysin-like protein
MIHNVFDFQGVKVRDVMVPLPKVVAVSPDTSIDGAVALAVSFGLDRLPVITAQGQPSGLINVLDILLEKNGAKTLNHYMRRIVTANEEEPAYKIVQRLRVARLGLAAVLDRERRLRGIVTIEDLVRRLVSSTEARA